MLRLVAGAIIILGLAAPTAAQEKKPSASKTATKQRCEVQQEIGSRLGRKRVCMSEAEWRQMRADTRTEVEKILAQKPLKGD